MKWKLLREFVKDPRRVGAIVPSSNGLAEAMTAQLELSSAQVVAEFGAGSGVFTSLILQRLPADALFFVVEKNPALARHLRRRFPGMHLVEDSVENLSLILERLQQPAVDRIVSSLPWAFFEAEQQDALLSQIVSALRPGGVFVTYAYAHGAMLPSGIRFRKRLERSFASVDKSEVVFRNIPPAFVYRCLK
ncbi:MAG TPA: methyltransferase domain-containing protein [Acidobacteriota bacterium]|nr:methyltransferase domain-containing protein [Acidobacteriota bacterium]